MPTPPPHRQFDALVFARSPVGEPFPNTRLPLIVVRGAFAAAEAEGLEDRLAAQGWSNSWRGPLFQHHHYHCNTHEALLLVAGVCAVRFGGPEQARDLSLAAGDMLLVPAGLAHKLVEASEDYVMLGAYPGGADPDYGVGSPGERPAADARIDAVAAPAHDPLGGALTSLWASAAAALPAAG